LAAVVSAENTLNVPAEYKLLWHYDISFIVHRDDALHSRIVSLSDK